MKKDLRVVICIIALVLLALLCFFKCSAEIEDESGEGTTGAPQVSEQPLPTRVIVIPGDENGENHSTDIGLVTIEYYTITGAGNTRIDTAEALIKEGTGITASTIVDFCLDSFTDEELDVNVLDVSQKEGICTVNFDSSIRKIAKDGRVTEVCVLDALAMSILDNCKDVVSVSFTINGEAYVTDNITLDVGEVYLRNR